MLIVVMVASFLTTFIGSSINLALPSIGTQFQGGALLLSWIVTAYLLATAAFLLPFGRLADMLGRRKVFLTGLALFSCSSFLSGMAWSVEVLFFFRIIQGMASAMIFSTGMAILVSSYPAEKRGKVIGFNSAAVYIGLSLGPVLGGFLNYYFGWRSIFYFTTVLSVVAFGLTLLQFKEAKSKTQEETFDFAGSIGYMIAIVATLYGFSDLARAASAKYILGLGIFIMILFLYYETKQKQPLFPVSLFFENMQFAFSNLAAMVNYSATFAIGFLLSLHLQVVVQLDSQAAGLVLLAQPLVMALFSPFAGALSDRRSPTVVASIGMAISAIGLFCFSFITIESSLLWIIAVLALVGFGFALFGPPNNNAIMGSVTKEFYGAASSALAAMRLIGQAVSMAIVTLLLSDHSQSLRADLAYKQQLIDDFHKAFLIFAVLCTLGIVASVARGRKRTKEQS